MTAILLVYLLGVVVVSVCVAVSFELDGGIDMPDALVAAMMGLLWPPFVPLFILGFAIKVIGQAIARALS